MAGVGGWEWDVKQQTMFWTQESYRIHDLVPGELIPGSAEHVARSLACYDASHRPRIMEAFRRCAEEGAAYDIELPFTSAKGRRLWVRTIAEAVLDHGRVARVVGYIMDITERKRLEEILQARLRLSEAVATLSLEDLLQRALDETERLTGSCIGFIHFVEEDQRTLSLQMWSTNTLEKMCTAEGKGRHYDLGEAGVWVDCIRERRPVIHNDYAALPHRKGLPAGHAPVVRELAVPILRNDRIVAVLGVGNKPQDYGERDVETVESLANLAWDIVLRKKAEEQLELQGMVLDQASNRVVITDMNGVIRYANQAQCRAVKRPREELIGKRPSIFDEDPQRASTQQEILESTLAHGEWRGEVVNRAADGNESVIDLRTFIVRTRTGKPIALGGIGTDITARKEAEHALTESRNRLEQLYLNMPDAFFLLDAETGIVLDANPAAARLMDMPMDRIVGLHVLRLHPADESESIAADFKKLVESDVFSRSLRSGHVLRPDGSRIPVEMTGSVYRLQGRPVVQGVMRDVSERRKAEDQLHQSQMELRDLYLQLQNAREEERRRISREIHDELGQNITALQLDLAWLKKRVDPVRPDLLDKLDAMNHVAESTLTIVRRVSAELRPGILDALGLTAAVDWLVRDFEKRSEILCSLLIEPEEIEVEQNLATDVFRVLQEALTNVARHARASSLQVTLRQNEGMLELEVADDGIGISEEEISRPASLGLLGIRERLLAHGGDIALRRLPGQGTCLSAAIPTRGKEGLK